MTDTTGTTPFPDSPDAPIAKQHQNPGPPTSAGRAKPYSGYGPVARMLSGPPPMGRALPAFNTDVVPDSPAELFVQWLAEAKDAGVLDPHAVTLATAGTNGMPDARIVLLRDLDLTTCGWVFATDSTSPKGTQLAENPAAAMSLYWPRQGRQIRIRGTVRAWEPAACADEFRTRPPNLKIASLVGRQSEPLQTPAEYDQAVLQATELLNTHPDVAPPDHTLYTLRAQETEFWQADRGQRHVRLHYAQAGPAWHRTLLWP
ncbi:pyridoxine/pyridoxamine 5'-phosphate oxidase [Streptomyces microflavus]|uniref:Pyridoxal 5'-phosphate synthase n=1 Tax=Streptomyces microflavus TaxID=1919 RepID=A0A7H8N0R7_STRMI|nr:pyridoxal 5'-phosphate synthase [Streptomyces microflavus]QKW47913.1 pyridoxal 5'-phosphate synthase [Streptomyces microflavus]